MAKQEADVDYTAYVDKAPTALQQHIADWLTEVTEYDPAKAKTKAAAFEMGVKLTVALRMKHQASPENQERLAELRDGAEEKAAAKPAKKARKTKAAPEPEPEDDADEDDDEAEEVEAPAPKKKAAPRPAKAAKKKAARKAKAAEEDEDEELEAPF